MTSPIITSLAILKVNWERGRDYVENFVPLVAECIRLSQDDVVSLPALQGQLQTRFGLGLPQNVVNTILRRVQKRGYIRLENKVYIRNPEKLARLEFHHVQQQVVRMHEALTKTLVAFCSDRFGVAWSLEDAEAALQSYLEDNQLVVMSAGTRGTLIPVARHAVKSARFLVGAFVQHLQETHADELDYLETIVKGNMLANAVFLPDPNQALRKFRKTEVYLDTPFLIFALGYAGQPRKEPCVELLQLLYETGADLRCFRHTLDEVKGALDACVYRIRRGQITDAYGPSIEYFLSKGYTASDIELFIVQLERNLEASRIRIVDKPPYVPKYVIDEQALSEALNKQIAYRNPQALSRDVDSISAIMRLRCAREFYIVEECRALFVTTNTGLARVSREFFYRETTPGAIALCLTDHTLTNLLWLKRPLQAPDLPRKRIIADCYAATEPDEQLWRLYLAEIDKLQQVGQVTADDYYLLRHSLEAKYALMELTLGEEAAFTQGTVPEILELVRSRVQADLRSQLESEAKRRKAAEEALKAAELDKIARVTRIGARAERCASATAQVLEYGAMILLLIGTISTFPWELPALAVSPVKYGISFLQAVLFSLVVANLMHGTTVKIYIRKFEMALSQWIRKRLLALLES